MEEKITSKQEVAKTQQKKAKPLKEAENTKREVIVPWMKDVVFCTPEGFLPSGEDVVKALSDRSGIDERQFRKILNGNVDFKISSLNRIAEGLDLVYFLVPVVKSSGLRRKIAYFGKMVGHIWQIPSKKTATAMPYLFREFSAIKDVSTEVFTTIYELIQVASGAIKGGGKDAKLIEILKKCIDEIANLVHEEADDS